MLPSPVDKEPDFEAIMMGHLGAYLHTRRLVVLFIGLSAYLMPQIVNGQY